MSELNPSVIFAQYMHKELDQYTAGEYLKIIIEREESEQLRIEALRQLGKLGLKADAIFPFLENLLVSDQNSEMRQESAKIIFRNYLRESRVVFSHLLECEKSPDIIYLLYKTLEELNSEESNQFLRLMENKIGKHYVDKFEVTPKEAMALKLMEYQVGFEVKHTIYTFDEEHISVKPENGHVVSLDILGLNYSEIKYMEFFPNLESLTIQRTGLTQITGLETLINLTYLDLIENEISEIKGLETLVNLETLFLAENPITEIKGLDNLKKLNDVYFENNKIPEKEIEFFFNNFIPYLKRLVHDYWYSKDYDKALELCDRIIFIDSKQKEAFFYKGIINFERGKLKDSLKFYKKALRLDNKHQKSLYNLGISYLSLNKRIFALKSFLLALRSRDNKVNEEYIYFYIAKIHSDWEDYNRALKYALKAIESNPEFINGYFYVGYYNFRLRNYDQAITYIRIALEKNPYDLTYKRYLGLSYFNNQMWNKAICTFNQILKVNPKDILSMIKLGQICINNNKPIKATNYLKKVLAYEELNYIYCETLAKDFIKLENYDLALFSINRAIDQEPKLKSLQKIRKEILFKKNG